MDGEAKIGPGTRTSNKLVAGVCLAFFGGMIGMAYAAVPLYAMFCQMTGYGGTTSTIQGHRDSILAVAFSPDGGTIASASYDKLIKLWTVADGKVIATLKEHSDAVYAVAFMPGGAQVLSAAGDRTVKVWDVSTGKRLFTVNDSLDAVYTAAVHPSGRWFAAAGADRMIRTWAWNRDASSGAAATARIRARRIRSRTDAPTMPKWPAARGRTTRATPARELSGPDWQTPARANEVPGCGLPPHTVAS